MNNNNTIIKRMTKSRTKILNFIKTGSITTAVEISCCTLINISQVRKTLSVFLEAGLVYITYDSDTDSLGRVRKNTKFYSIVEEEIDTDTPVEEVIAPEAIVVAPVESPVDSLLKLEVAVLIARIKRLKYSNPTADDVNTYTKRVKSMLSKTHPDRVVGYEEEAVILTKALKDLKEITTNNHLIYVEGWGYVSKADYEIIVDVSKYYQTRNPDHINKYGKVYSY